MDGTRRVELPVLYFGTPVALITTVNPDGSSNISPISSAWALGDRYMLGLGADGQAVADPSEMSARVRARHHSQSANVV